MAKKHEKTFNFTNDEGNADQNHNVIAAYSFKNDHNKNRIDFAMNVVKREPFHTAGGNVKWYNHYGKQCGGSLKN